eukprot:c20770_g1_i1.p1 GENE.c20770_g1_i1~~c20770_g1_i1.p1  ORF type:complete len:177 (-),score=65.80 c20770_g1_i1:62-592(-)
MSFLLIVLFGTFSIVFPTFGFGPLIVEIGYPVFCSAQSLSIKNEIEQLTSCKNWLSYWIIDAIFICAKFVLESSLPVSIPLVLEIPFLFWLQVPYFSGSMKAFNYLWPYIELFVFCIFGSYHKSIASSALLASSSSLRRLSRLFVSDKNGEMVEIEKLQDQPNGKPSLPTKSKKNQ